jgi:glycosyltransferase involved in cell wall biosynthesis/predicted ATP-grasp superfamily ATP-dependent carboligase
MQARQRAILITCAAQNAALASIRSLHRAGWRVSAVDHDPRAVGLASRGCDVRLIAPVSPAAQPAAWADWLLDALRCAPVDVLLPVTDAAIFALLPRREEVEALAAVPWPSTAALESAIDKNATFALARELGINLPPMRLLNHGEAIPPDVAFPVVIKPGRTATIGRRIAVEYAENRDGLAAILALLPPDAFPVTLQTRVVGAGEGYFAVWRDGEPVVEFAHRRRREMPPSGGVSTLREAIALPDDLREPSRRLLARWRWHGPAMVEFKRGADGRPYLMEVNGRVWGSLQLAVDAGVDVPLASALVALGEPVPPMPYAVGVKTRWTPGDLNATLTRLLKHNRALRLPPGAPSRLRWLTDFILDFFRADVRSELYRRDDRGPWLAAWRNWWRNERALVRKRLQPGRRVRLLAHMHTDFSYDGEVSVARLAELLRRCGVAVCCIADHARGLTEADVRRLVEECARHSDENLLLVPGLEFDADGGTHILGLGMTQLPPQSAPRALCDAIRAAGGVAVLAHPQPGDLMRRPELVRAIDFVEVWNTMHDGDYLPNPTALAELAEARAAGADIAGTHGNDFHFFDNYRRSEMMILVPEAPLTWPAVAAALRARRYAMTNGVLAVRPAGVNACELAFLRLLRAAQRAASWVKRQRAAAFSSKCWDYMGCRAEVDCCPAVTAREGGRICWRVVGTFAGVDRRGPCCRSIPDCRECDFYRWRNGAWEGPRPLRVLQLIETGNPGGAEHMMVRLATSLDAGRFRSQALLLKEGWLADRLRAAGVPTTVAPLRRRFDLRFLWRLARLARRRRIDVLHSHEFTMNAYAFAAGLMARKPTVATVHGNLEYAAARRRRRLVYRTAARLAGPLIAVSRDTRRRLTTEFRLPAERVQVVPNGIALPAAPPDRETARAWRREWGLPEDGFLIGAVGRLQPVKGYDLLVRALSLLAERGVDARLAFVGQGDERTALERLARRLAIAERVVFCGYREEIPARLGAFDVIVAPSRYEGLSLALIEAMASWRPVIASDVGGNPEAIEDGVSGLLTPPEDPNALAAAIAQVALDPDLARRLGEGARARAEQEFSITAMIAAYERLYDDRARRT